MDLQLTGRTALVTGGSGGIGGGLVLGFAREGANVVSVDLDTGDRLIEEAQRQKLPGTVFPVQGDITTTAGVDAIFAATHERFGPVDILVNNAGGGAKVVFVEDEDEEARQWEIAVNINGMINCCMAASKDMRVRGKGSIVNIASNAGLLASAASPGTHYAGTKGFMISYGRGLANQWAEHNIRINTIAPGLIVPHSSEAVSGEHSWWNRLSIGKPEDFSNTGGDASIFTRSGCLIQRVGRPEDIANVALFFASDVSSYLTGQIISVSGGGWMP